MKGIEVKQFRDLLGLTRKEFCPLIGIKERQLIRMENEGKEPEPQMELIINLLKDLAGTKLGKKYGV